TVLSYGVEPLGEVERRPEVDDGLGRRAGFQHPIPGTLDAHPAQASQVQGEGVEKECMVSQAVSDVQRYPAANRQPVRDRGEEAIDLRRCDHVWYIATLGGHPDTFGLL